MCVKNESFYLPGFLKHIDKYIDGLVVLDDGSTDNTIEILTKYKKTVHIIKRSIHTALSYDEKGNRQDVIKAAYNCGADWVLCCDPDERFESLFLKNIRTIISRRSSKEPVVYRLHFRELWDAINQYRSDGIWDTKSKGVLFPLSEKMSFNYPYSIHAPWHYKELDGKQILLDYSIYHLKMVKEIERIKRRNLYEFLDPNHEIQPIGYDYLIDDNNLKITKIEYKNRYDYSTCPDELKKE